MEVLDLHWQKVSGINFIPTVEIKWIIKCLSETRRWGISKRLMSVVCLEKVQTTWLIIHGLKGTEWPRAHRGHTGPAASPTCPLAGTWPEGSASVGNPEHSDNAQRRPSRIAVEPSQKWRCFGLWVAVRTRLWKIQVLVKLRSMTPWRKRACCYSQVLLLQV